MTTYVLVHGAWAGAHGWHLVRPLIREAGHEVTTPSLTGIGERVHLTSPQVGLSTHIQDLVNHVEFEDLNDIVLVGFSYGGAVVSGALEHLAERVKHLVYLDAFVPTDGQSLASVTGRSAPPPFGADWLVPPTAREFEDPAEGAWSTPRRVPMPSACFTETVHLVQPLEDYPFTRTFIKATVPARTPETSGTPLWLAADRAKESPQWQYHEIDTNHMIPNNRPAELVEILLSLT